VLRAADARISHDGRPAAGFISSRPRPVAPAAVAGRAIESVRAAELVAHLVRDKINRESIARGTGKSGHAARLVPGHADYAKPGNAAASRAEHVADVVVGCSDYRIEIR